MIQQGIGWKIPIPRGADPRRLFPLYQFKVDAALGFVELALEGTLREDEMRRFVEECLAAIRGSGRAPERGWRVLADMSRLRTTSPEAAEVLRVGQMGAMGAGMTRIAEVVGSEVTALQLNRVARASGMDRMLRRFHDRQEARRWVLEGGDQLDAA